MGKDAQDIQHISFKCEWETIYRSVLLIQTLLKYFKLILIWLVLVLTFSIVYIDNMCHFMLYLTTRRIVMPLLISVCQYLATSSARFIWSRVESGLHLPCWDKVKLWKPLALDK